MGRDPSGLLFYGIYIPEDMKLLKVADKEFEMYQFHDAYLYHKGFSEINPLLRKYFGYKEPSKEEVDKYNETRSKLLSDLKYSIGHSGCDESMRDFIYYSGSMKRSEWGDIIKLPYSDLSECLDRGMSTIDDELEELCAIFGIPFKYDDCNWYLTSLYL